MKLKIAIVYVLFVTLTEVYASDKSGKYEVLGQGMQSCGAYVQSRKGDHLKEVSFMVWVAGFLTAYNMYTPDTYDVTANVDLDGLMGWLENYCGANPLKNFSSAVDSLVSELRPKRRR